MESRYNLIDEEWIPVVGAGKVGLRKIFSDPSLASLGGNPIEKIAVFKLLLAVAQSAFTPKDEDGWKSSGREGMQDAVLKYLDSHRDCFWLYGERPFLQVPEIRKAEKKPFGALKMEVAVGNTTVVTQIQNESPLDDSEKALLLLVQMNFSLGGKKVDNKIVLSDGYKKSITGKFGSSLGSKGFLHTFLLMPTILDSVYMNLFSLEVLAAMGGMFSGGVGNAPWEKMPAGEDDGLAREYKKTYLSRLVALNRFVLLDDEKIHYSEGLQLPDYSEFVVDPSVTVNFTAKPKPKAVWTDPERKPWRELTSMLAFMDGTKDSDFICYQLKACLSRETLKYAPNFSIWSAGVKVSSNAGEQFLTGKDDFVESEIKFCDYFSDEKEDINFYASLTGAMSEMENKSNVLFSCVDSYYKDLKVDGKKIAKNSTNIFWQLCESEFQNVIGICSHENAEENLKPSYKKFFAFVCRIYDETCPKDTARQMEAWAKNRPHSNKIKNREEK